MDCADLLKEDGLSILEWKHRAVAAEDLVQRLRDIIQKLEDEKAALLLEFDPKRKRKSSRPTQPIHPSLFTPAPEIATPHNRRQSLKSARKEPNPIAPQSRTQNTQQAAKLAIVTWLKTDETLSEYLPIFDDTAPSGSSLVTKMFSEKILRPDDPNPKPQMELDQVPLSSLLDYLFLPPNHKISLLWDQDQFKKDFLLIFRSFLTRKKFIAILNEELQYAPQQRKESAVSIASSWVEARSSADFRDKKTQRNWKKFVVAVEKSKLWAGNSFGKIEPFNVDKRDSSNCPAIIEPTGEITLISLNSLEIARQLTLQTETFYRAIPVSEFLKSKCYCPKLIRKRPHIRRFIDHIDFVSCWVQAQVLVCPDRKGRVVVLEKMIEIAKFLKQLHNYPLCFSVVTVLRSDLSRLRRDWKEVGRDPSSDFESLQIFTDNSNKFRIYNTELASLSENEAAIPMIQIMMADLEKLDEVYRSNKVDDPPGWINWYKLHTVAKCLAILKERPLYQLQKSERIQEFLNTSESWKNSNANYFICSLRESVIEWPHPIQRTPTSALWSASSSTFSNDDWNYLLRVTEGKTVHYSKGEDILKIGEANIRLFRIVKGEVVIKKTETVFVPLSPGDVFGEVSLCIQDHGVTKTVTANSFCELQILEFSDLVTRLNHLPLLSLQFYRWLAILLAKRFIKTVSSDEAAILCQAKTALQKEKNWRTIFGFPPDEEIIQVVPCIKVKGNSKQVGNLAITTNQVAWMRTNFGFSTIQKVPLADIMMMSKKKDVLQINNWSFSGFEQDKSKIHTLIVSLRDQASVNPQLRKTEEGPSSNQESVLERWAKTKAVLEMTPEDWKIILRGSLPAQVTKDSVLLDKNSNVGDIFQLCSGTCTLIVNEPSKSPANSDSPCAPKITLSAPETFGELSFLTGHKAQGSVIADEDLEVVTLSPYYLNILFQHYPAIGGRFYFFLARSVAKKAGY